MNTQALAVVTLLLVTPYNPAFFSQKNCLTSHFYGNYRDPGSGFYSSGWQSVFLTDATCLAASCETTDGTSCGLLSSPIPLEAISKDRKIFWIEEESVDNSLKDSYSFRGELDGFLERLSSPLVPANDEIYGQKFMPTYSREKNYDILHQTPSSFLISVVHDKADIIDTLLPRFWKAAPLPENPIAHYDVTPAVTQPAADVLSKLKFDPAIASIVNNISISQMRDDVQFLTGEDGKSGIVSRHSFTAGALTAAAWLKARFEDTGAKCQLKPFLAGFAPNVVCRYTSAVDTTSMVLLSAHYDSRGSFGSTRAPGGDDDGSGTTGLLAIARAIGRKGIQFHTNVELVAFAGEEQGLLGSRHYARELRNANANLTLVIQADMLAYRVPGEPMQLGLPDIIGSPVVAQLVANVSAIYSPELQVGFTPACCSDHQSFHEQGFPATQVFERVGPIADPKYHNSGDLSNREGYDFDQLKSIAKVQFATLLHAAGFHTE